MKNIKRILIMLLVFVILGTSVMAGEPALVLEPVKSVQLNNVIKFPTPKIQPNKLPKSRYLIYFLVFRGLYNAGINYNKEYYEIHPEQKQKALNILNTMVKNGELGDLDEDYINWLREHIISPKTLDQEIVRSTKKLVKGLKGIGFKRNDNALVLQNFNKDSVLNQYYNNNLSEENKGYLKEISQHMKYDPTLKHYSFRGITSKDPYELLPNMSEGAQKLFRDMNSDLWYFNANNDFSNQFLTGSMETKSFQTVEEFLIKHKVKYNIPTHKNIDGYNQSVLFNVAIKYMKDNNIYYTFNNIVPQTAYPFKVLNSYLYYDVDSYNRLSFHLAYLTESGQYSNFYTTSVLNTYMVNSFDGSLVSTTANFSLDLYKCKILDFGITSVKDNAYYFYKVKSGHLIKQDENTLKDLFDESFTNSPSLSYKPSYDERPIIIPNENIDNAVVAPLKVDEGLNPITINETDPSKVNITSDPLNPNYNYITNNYTTNNNITNNNNISNENNPQVDPNKLKKQNFKLVSFLISKVPFLSDLTYFIESFQNLDISGSKPYIKINFDGFMGMDGQFQVIDFTFFDMYKKYIFDFITYGGWILVIIKISKALPLYYKE